jgi:hypothetical protein
LAARIEKGLRKSWLTGERAPLASNRLDPAGVAGENKSPTLTGIEGKHVKITGRIEM